MARRRRRAQWLIFVLLLGTMQAAFAGSTQAVPTPDDADPAPSADLLMFLADFDDSDGEVVDRSESAVSDQRDAQAGKTREGSDDG